MVRPDRTASRAGHGAAAPTAGELRDRRRERYGKARLREKHQGLSCKTVVKTCRWNAVCRKSEQTKRLA